MHIWCNVFKKTRLLLTIPFLEQSFLLAITKHSFREGAIPYYLACSNPLFSKGIVKTVTATQLSFNGYMISKPRAFSSRHTFFSCPVSPKNEMMQIIVFWVVHKIKCYVIASGAVPFLCCNWCYCGYKLLQHNSCLSKYSWKFSVTGEMGMLVILFPWKKMHGLRFSQNYGILF